jgi:hypothetical protein
VQGLCEHFAFGSADRLIERQVDKVADALGRQYRLALSNRYLNKRTAPNFTGHEAALLGQVIGSAHGSKGDT